MKLKLCKHCRSREVHTKRNIFCSLQCMGLGRKGKNNPWYGKPSPMTRFREANGIPVKNKQAKRISLGRGKRMLLHRYLMEIKLGRRLKAAEIVHHIDHNNQNNSPENLQLMPSIKAHLAHHWRILKGGDARCD